MPTALVVIEVSLDWYLWVTAGWSGGVREATGETVAGGSEQNAALESWGAWAEEPGVTSACDGPPPFCHRGILGPLWLERQCPELLHASPLAMRTSQTLALEQFQGSGQPRLSL